MQHKLKGLKFFNNGLINVRSLFCPEGFTSGRIQFKRKSPSAETKIKLSNSHKGQTAWNKGKHGLCSQSTLSKMSLSAKKRAARGILPNNKGKTPWNFGLTAENSISVRSYASSQRGQIRSGDYKKAEYDISQFKNYQKEVRRLTAITYKKYKNDINPLNHPRGIANKLNENLWHIDHITTILDGFKNKIKPEVLARKENLRMLPWRENLMRSKI